VHAVAGVGAGDALAPFAGLLGLGLRVLGVGGGQQVARSCAPAGAARAAHWPSRRRLAVRLGCCASAGLAPAGHRLAARAVPLRRPCRAACAGPAGRSVPFAVVDGAVEALQVPLQQGLLDALAMFSDGASRSSSSTEPCGSSSQLRWLRVLLTMASAQML
jgi:hypothetical protein